MFCVYVFTCVYHSITYTYKSEVHLGWGPYMLSHLTVIPIPPILKSKWLFLKKIQAAAVACLWSVLSVGTLYTSAGNEVSPLSFLQNNTHTHTNGVASSYFPKILSYYMCMCAYVCIWYVYDNY